MVRKIRRRRNQAKPRRATLRQVPAHIPRPSYAETGRPPPRMGLTVHPPERIERMRAACALTRALLDEVLAAVEPGITTDALDALAHRRAIEEGAYPSTLNYGGFSKSLCTSINDVVCHGIPGDRILERGDIVNCDLTLFIGGVHGDCSETVFVGDPDDAARRLVETTYDAMMAGIAVARPGRPIHAIGRAIQNVAHANGYGVVEAFAGHGIGEHFHTDPTVPHYFDASASDLIRPGMTFTVEPMLNEGSPECTVLSDGWTAVTLDGGRSAQFEHTLLITDDGAELLTARDGPPVFRQQ